MINWIKSWFKPYDPKFKEGDIVVLIDEDIEKWERATVAKICHVGKRKYGYRFQHFRDYNGEMQEGQLYSSPFRVFESCYTKDSI